jgi:hypothetical protein
MRTKRIFFIFIFLNLYQLLYCQNISVQAKVDTQKILIGDWIKLNIKAQHSSDIKLFWPDIDNNLGKFEVVKRDSFPQIIQENGQTIEQINAIVSAYDSGYFQIPAIKFEFSSQNDTSNKKELFTEAINIAVNSIAVDTTKDIKDIKDPLDIPFPLWLIITYIAIAIFIFLIAFLIWNKIKNKKGLPIFEKTEPKLTAHELAYKELYLLEERKLWQKGQLKEYYSEVTEIIRKYLQNRYGIDAMEMTSDEILDTLINIHGDQKIQEVLKLFLSLADYVKFAKFQPIPNENEVELKRAYNFVDATREKPVETQETKNSEKQSD